MAGEGVLEDVTGILERWSRGDRTALEDLLPLVYAELRRLAASHLRRESPGNTLEPTALVHEAYLRLAGRQHVQFNNRAQFFGCAAVIIRRILLDHARRTRAAKRGHGFERVTLAEAESAQSPRDVDLLELDAALTELEGLDQEKARVVELRYFTGLSIPETAEVLNVSPSTVKRQWAIARAWLYDRLQVGRAS